jgi:hypothetical protein
MTITVLVFVTSHMAIVFITLCATTHSLFSLSLACASASHDFILFEVTQVDISKGSEPLLVLL